MKILICGDRNWSNREVIKRELSKILGTNHVVIHGGANGADKLAGEVAKGLGFKVVVFPADWEKYGKVAGMLRNTEMLMEKPELILAFHPDLSQSKGTKGLLKIASKMHIPYKHFTK